MGSDALQLGRQVQAWWKVTATYWSVMKMTMSPLG